MFDNQKLKDAIQILGSLYSKLKSIDNNHYADIVIKVLDNLIFISDSNSNFINNAFQDGFRYIDYYYGDMNAETAINYFNENYNGDDKEYRFSEFLLYCLMTNLQELFGLFDLKEFGNLNELLSLLDFGDFYNKIQVFSKHLDESLKDMNIKTNNELSFLNPKNKYLIYFTGNSLEDIKRLPKDKLIPLINKLDTPLATQVIIPYQESMGHLHDAYDFSAARIHLVRGYRIVYTRYLNITAIIGVIQKTGNDDDYRKYDFIAKKKKAFYEELKRFYNGDIPKESDHYKVIEILEQALKKYNSR